MSYKFHDNMSELLLYLLPFLLIFCILVALRTEQYIYLLSILSIIVYWFFAYSFMVKCQCYECAGKLVRSKRNSAPLHLRKLGIYIRTSLVIHAVISTKFEAIRQCNEFLIFDTEIIESLIIITCKRMKSYQ